MMIYDHGTWSRYSVANLPGYAPMNAMFCRNDTSGVDWYDYIKQRNLSDESIKLVCFSEGGNWIVKVATVDGSRLFPQSARLLELYDGDLDDPTTAYVGKVYDPATNTLGDPTPPPQSKLVASARQVRLALNQLGLRQAIENYVASQGIEVKDSWEFSTEFEEDHPLIKAGQPVLGITDEQVRAIFDLAVTL